jgi:hypothetical protein
MTNKLLSVIAINLTTTKILIGMSLVSPKRKS